MKFTFLFMLFWISTSCTALETLKLTQANVYADESVKVVDLFTIDESLKEYEKLSQLVLTLPQFENVYSRDFFEKYFEQALGKKVAVKGWPKVRIWRCKKNVSEEVKRHIGEMLTNDFTRYGVRIEKVDVAKKRRLCIDTAEHIIALKNNSATGWSASNSVNLILNTGREVKTSVSLSLSQLKWSAKRALKMGEVVTKADFEKKQKKVYSITQDIELNDIRNYKTTRFIKKGGEVNTTNLRLVKSISQGQLVKVKYQGNGFQLLADAVAVSNADIGEIVKVKLIDSASVIDALVQSNKEVHVL